MSNDIIEQLKDAVSTSDFETKYNKLFDLYSLALSDSKKSKDEQLFYPELKALVFRFFKDVYDVSESRSPNPGIRNMIL